VKDNGILVATSQFSEQGWGGLFMWNIAHFKRQRQYWREIILKKMVKALKQVYSFLYYAIHMVNSLVSFVIFRKWGCQCLCHIISN
jgi:hypothetical protein